MLGVFLKDTVGGSRIKDWKKTFQETFARIKNQE